MALSCPLKSMLRCSLSCNWHSQACTQSIGRSGRSSATGRENHSIPLTL